MRIWMALFVCTALLLSGCVKREVKTDGKEDTFLTLKEALEISGQSEVLEMSFLDGGMSDEKINGESVHVWSAGENHPDQFAALRHFYVALSGAVYEMDVVTAEYVPVNTEAEIAMNWTEDLLFAAFTDPYQQEYAAFYAGQPEEDHAVLVAMQDDVTFQIERIEYDENTYEFHVTEQEETIHVEHRGQAVYVSLHHTEMLPEYRVTARHHDITAVYYAAYDGKDEDGKHYRYAE